MSVRAWLATLGVQALVGGGNGQKHVPTNVSSAGDLCEKVLKKA
jgi:hypothetical protein